MKSDGSVRICEDYKVTVNCEAKLDKYLIPPIDDLFVRLAGGQRFMKLDLSHAYQQIQLDPDSHKYVTINMQKGLFTYNRSCIGPLNISAYDGVRVARNSRCMCLYWWYFGHWWQRAQHLDHLEEVLRRLKEAGMQLKSYHWWIIWAIWLAKRVFARQMWKLKLEAIIQAPAGCGKTLIILGVS